MRLALVSLASLVDLVHNGCLSVPPDGMRRRRRESPERHGLLCSGRVAGSQGGGVSPIPVGRLCLRLLNYVALATANGQARAKEWAARGGKRRNTAAHEHENSLGAFRMALRVGVDEAGSVSWRSRGRRLVGSAARRLDRPL